MRQAGLKPKSHSSGVYWVRANAKPGGGRTKAKASQKVQEIEFPLDENGKPIYDTNGNGKTDLWGWILYAPPSAASPPMWFVTLFWIGVIALIAIL